MSRILTIVIIENVLFKISVEINSIKIIRIKIYKLNNNFYSFCFS